MGGAVSRRDFIRRGAITAAGFGLLHTVELHPDYRFDLVLKGGTVLDGTGGTAFMADIGIVGDTIEAVGLIDEEQGRKVIQAGGRHVCPGFIDIHSHSDGMLLVYPTAESRVMQGVTTELTGNCGFSAAPLCGVDAELHRTEMLERDDIRAEWTTVDSYFGVVERTGVAVNHAMLLGHGSLRWNTVGPVNRLLSPDELQAVVLALEEGMDQGAFGLSSGLEYVPGSYSPAEELISLAEVVARRGGLYATHMRAEGALLLEAVAEALEVGRRTGVRVEISHLKAAGRPNWHKQSSALDMLEAAAADGLQVRADAYPYPAYSTSLTIFLPAWSCEGGTEALLARLKDPAQIKRIKDEMTAQVLNDPGDFDLIIISRLKSAKNKGLVGQTLMQIADLWAMEPAGAAVRLLIEEQTQVEMIGFGMKPENVAMVLSHPLVMVGSDGYSFAPRGKIAEARPHPRSYGAFARILGYYAREQKIFDLPEAIRKMTSMPADQIGLRDRGRIGRGMKADIVVFDAGKVRDTATFQDPQTYAMGMEHVLVNGVAVVENGKHTGGTPGRVLRKT